MDDPLEKFRGKHGRYLSLTTYKRNGDAVTTPTWCWVDEDRIFMRTDSTSWKVKRMRRNASVMVAPCDGRGKTDIEPIPGRARELPLSDGGKIVKAYVRKYPIGYIFEVALLRPLYRVTHRIGIGKRRGSPLFFEIVPVVLAGEPTYAALDGGAVNGVAVAPRGDLVHP